MKCIARRYIVSVVPVLVTVGIFRRNLRDSNRQPHQRYKGTTNVPREMSLRGSLVDAAQR